jgi:hypothetical protein
MKDKSQLKDSFDFEMSKLSDKIAATKMFVKIKQHAARTEENLHELNERRSKFKDCNVRDNVQVRKQEYNRYLEILERVEGSYNYLVKKIHTRLADRKCPEKR